MVTKWLRFSQRTLLLGGLCFTVLAQQASADSLIEQRSRYQQIRLAWDNKDMAEVERLMPTLKHYPLYPYLEYRQMSQNLSSLTVNEVNQFISRYPTLPVASNLSRNFSAELARRGQWKALLQFSKEEPKAIAARCQYHYANWAIGHKKQAFDAVPALWLSGSSLPAQCDPLFNVWRQAGHQTSDLMLQRILLAAQAGKKSQGLAGYLIKQLPENQKALGEAVIQLQEKPETLEEFAKQFPPNNFTKDVVLKTFPLFSRKDFSAARAAIPALVKSQKLSGQQQLALEKNVAGRLMNNGVSQKEMVWRDEVIGKSGDVSLIERRIRLALISGNDKDLASWLAALPDEAKQKEEWRYWRAALLLKQKGKRAEGEKILHQLMDGRGFYPMVAAQKLNKPYHVRVLKADGEKKADKRILNRPEMARVTELLYWQQENLARSEWIRFVGQFDKPHQEMLARYAFDKGWADLSVQATITGKLWNHLEERFPVAYPQYYEQALKDKTISTTFAMAITRQESAWNPQAQSPVGARGLMQIMPKTAKETAKMIDLKSYQNVNQLLDPETNIQIGTAYLEYVYQTFGNNRILAAAAYNAGPHRVTSWLANSGGRIDAVAFVESIPFNETRGYVKNVLSYDVFYGYFMKTNSEVLNKDELQRQY
jgi:soluble lytic murein transglycosylase